MIIIRIMAGLGNQMFQYALYRRLQYDGKEVFGDVSSYKQKNIHNGYELERIFNLVVQQADDEKLRKVYRPVSNLNYTQRLIRKLTLTLGFPYKHYIEKEFYSYDPHIVNLEGDYYLEGYWQAEQYFKPIEAIIRRDFTFVNPLDSENEQRLNKIQASYSTSIHIRRGDFVAHPLHGNICTLEYYKKAIKYMYLPGELHLDFKEIIFSSLNSRN